jgi:uncharacterized protein
MKLEQSFEIKAPLQEVWAALIDIERVAPCLPGAEVTGREGDSYQGTFQVKLGPTTAAYRGTLKMLDLDEDAHLATMSANAQEKRGGGTAKATMVSRMTDAGEATRVEVQTDFTLTGRLARFGRGGMIQDVSNRLLREFAECLQSTLASGAGAVAPSGAGPAPVGAPAQAQAGPDGGRSGAEEPDLAAELAAGGPAGTLSRAGTVEVGVDELRAIRLELAALRREIEALSARGGEPAPAPKAKPINALSLLFSVLAGRVKRLLGRPE